MLKTLAKGVTAALLVLLPLTLGPAAVHAQQTSSYDYHQPTEMMVNYGRQALMICNGLFVSNRSLDLIYEQELKLNRMPVLPPSMVTIDKERQAVAVGGGGNGPYPTMRAAYREGLGCIVMAPNQTFDNIDDLPMLTMAPPPGNPAQIAWPDGDLIPDINLPTSLSASGGGLVAGIFRNGGIPVLLQAVQRLNHAKILSMPSVVTYDNSTAILTSLNEQPVFEHPIERPNGSFQIRTDHIGHHPEVENGCDAAIFIALHQFVGVLVIIFG
ncbi:MAG: hypothetical protein IH786_02895 [Proteobacteria bacterium]|nr:hypothetical protein [Pseudomonadota bacterium]